MNGSLHPVWRLAGFWGLGCAVLCVLVLASLSLGSSTVRPWHLLQPGPDQALAWQIVQDLRLPRTLAALAIGGLLGLAGLLQQVLLRNPMADPYVLGSSGGASVGALLAMLLGWGAWGVSAAAGLGALACTALVLGLAGAVEGRYQAHLLLTGIAVAAFTGALSTLMLSLAPDGVLRGMVFWMLGDLSSASWEWATWGVAVLLLLVWPLAPLLNVLGQGWQSAYGLGVPVQALSWVLHAVSALATALAVSSAGLIGFVGLMVPHAVRLLVGHDLRQGLPASVWGGAVVLLGADVLSRTLAAPQQLPVGVVMALLGVPFFLFLLHTKRRHPWA